MASCLLRLGRGAEAGLGACLRQRGGPQMAAGAGGQGCTATVPPAPLTSSFTEESVPESALGCELLLCGDDDVLFPLLLIPSCPALSLPGAKESSKGWRGKWMRARGQRGREEGRGRMREKRPTWGGVGTLAWTCSHPGDLPYGGAPPHGLGLSPPGCFRLEG